MSDLEFEPVTASIGACVYNAELRAEMPEEQIEAIYRALQERLVLFFPDQHPSPETMLGIARRLGPLPQRHPLYPCVEGHDQVMLIVDDADSPPENEAWHADLTGRAKPPFAALLHGKEIPASGGDTIWCNMYAVYETLSPAMQRFLEGLTAIHDVPAAFQAITERDDVRAEGFAQMVAGEYRSRHPVVLHHPGTGRPLIFVNRTFTQSIVELSERESSALLEMLFALTEQPCFQVRFRWQAGSLALWDNWATQHFAVGDHYPQRRVMQRVTVADDARSGWQTALPRNAAGAAS